MAGRRLLEKMGWKAGEGLGKDGQGAQSCLVLRKTAGSHSQGRIEHMPMQHAAPTPAAAQSPATENTGYSTMGHDPYAMAAAQQALEEAQIRDVINQAQALAAASTSAEQSATRKRKTKWDGGGEVVPASSTVAAAEAAAAAVAANMGSPAGVANAAAPGMSEAMAAAAAAQLQMQLQGQLPIVTADAIFGMGGSTSSTPAYAAGTLPGLSQPPQKKSRKRQFVVDDWRWNNGSDALRSYVECQLTPELYEVAKQVFGKDSRFPARVADDCDVMVEVTAWRTVLLRPQGTGADLALAKSMVFDVLHPGGAFLRDDVLIKPDEAAEAAVADVSSLTEVSTQFEDGMARRKARLQRVGIGAEAEAAAESGKSVTKEIQLPRREDILLVQNNFDNIRIATGILPIMMDMTLMLIGPEKDVQKAEQLLRKLLITGQWAAFTESFVPSAEGREVKAPREPRRAPEADGPSEQIIIKIAEGQTTQLIEKHLKVMERAAEADKLKLTSKAVAGKRSLMVEGSKRSHERVKLMVKELAEKGESPMLTKALKAPYFPPPLAQKRPEPQQAATPAVSSSAKPGSDSMMAELAELAGSAPNCNVPGLGPGPAMRHLPAPKLTPGTVVPVKKAQPSATSATSDDLFAGLPAPEPASTSADAAMQMPVQTVAPSGAELQPAFGQSMQFTTAGGLVAAGDASTAEIAALAVAAERELLGLPPPGITE